ncbi:putative protein kinase RLK-Pelle-LRR-XI-1 family [Helianthus debilis subsp. tardiflorus]
MEKGSLFCALSNSELAVIVNWMKRVNIIKDVAHALAYMHHDCSPPIVHRDISTNNILLNSELGGFVSDFGAARLLDPDSSNQTVIHYYTNNFMGRGDIFYGAVSQRKCHICLWHSKFTSYLPHLIVSLCEYLIAKLIAPLKLPHLFLFCEK